MTKERLLTLLDDMSANCGIPLYINKEKQEALKEAKKLLENIYNVKGE